MLASVALHLRDPHAQGSWGLCPWFALTGTYCPGCGGLRAVHDLTNGDVVAAASSNLLFVASIPLLVAGWCRWLVGGWHGVARTVDLRHPYRFSIWVLAPILTFAFVRNLPFGSWLAP